MTPRIFLPMLTFATLVLSNHEMMNSFNIPEISFCFFPNCSFDIAESLESDENLFVWLSFP
jgi:hypothetical protein